MNWVKYSFRDVKEGNVEKGNIISIKEKYCKNWNQEKMV